MNFPLIMLIALLVTGGIWLLDVLWLKKIRAKEAKENWVIEYSKSFFPVILIVFLLRSFLVEPFKIPSGSMMPTLLVGDFILVNKYKYGIRLPVINKKIMEVEQPQRGDVMVFRYPEDISLDYIKRVVGLPGDKVVYENKKLSINGIPVAAREVEEYSYTKSGLNFVSAKSYVEQLGEHTYYTLVQPDEPNMRMGQSVNFPYRANCDYSENGFSCVVPAGHYFALGDNRDDSRDSRYWGFIPDENIVGKAFLIWLNFDNFKRIGMSIP